tara:strand:- start:1126 stop:1971 length:846 start_codon:yes stop_codon:yes gene_type:complete
LSLQAVVLGSSGFIGNNLSNYLSKKNYKILNFNSKNCNLMNEEAIKEAFSKINSDYSLIISSFITRSKEDTLESMIMNINMIKNLSKNINIKFLKKIIFISSVDVYGSNYKNKINENNKVNPFSYYGLSKFASEIILKKYFSKIPLVILRLPGVYGQNDKKLSIIGKLYHEAINNRKIMIYNKGSQLRDYIKVTDVSMIIEIFLNKSFEGVYNIVSGKSFSIVEIAKIIISNLDNNIEIIDNKSNSVSYDLVFDNSKFTSIFPNFVFTNIHKGIEEYINNL